MEKKTYSIQDPVLDGNEILLFDSSSCTRIKRKLKLLQVNPDLVAKENL